MDPSKSDSLRTLERHESEAYAGKQCKYNSKKHYNCDQCFKHFTSHAALKKHTNKGHCLGIEDVTGNIMKHKKASINCASETKGRLTASKAKSIPLGTRTRAKESVLECNACHEPFPALKVLKRHLKYCVFNS